MTDNVEPSPESVPPLPIPPPPPVPEVEAVPLPRAEKGGPTIDMPPPPRSEPPVIAKPRPRWRDHVWAALCHLLLFLVIPTVFLGAVLTFFLWQLKGRRSAQIEDQGREALNFQINVAVVTTLLGVTCLGGPLVPIVWLVALIFCVIAATHAARGESYRYPWVLRVVTH